MTAGCMHRGCAQIPRRGGRPGAATPARPWCMRLRLAVLVAVALAIAISLGGCALPEFSASAISCICPRWFSATERFRQRNRFECQSDKDGSHRPAGNLSECGRATFAWSAPNNQEPLLGTLQGSRVRLLLLLGEERQTNCANDVGNHVGLGPDPGNRDARSHSQKQRHHHAWESPWWVGVV